MKLYPIRLLQTAIINGLPRSPVEGIQLVTKAERDRLVDDVKQAEDAEDDVDRDDDGDGLDRKTVKELSAVADKEGATFENGAKKADILAAIRTRRDIFAGTSIDPVSDEGLRKRARDIDLTLDDDADTAAIVAALKQKLAQA
jgi:hypothetical protein